MYTIESSGFIYDVELVKSSFPPLKPPKPSGVTENGSSTSNEVLNTPKNENDKQKQQGKEDELSAGQQRVQAADAQSISSSNTTTTTASRFKAMRLNPKSVASTPIGVRTKAERVHAIKVCIWNRDLD